MAENKWVCRFAWFFFSPINGVITDWWDLVGPYGVGWWKMKVWLKILYLNMFYVILLMTGILRKKMLSQSITYTPRKTNMDTKNCHSWKVFKGNSSSKPIMFKVHMLVFGSFYNFMCPKKLLAAAGDESPPSLGDSTCARCDPTKWAKTCWSPRPVISSVKPARMS